jgi:oxygen-independent coproporphyrinogen-3 oxidase
VSKLGIYLHLPFCHSRCSYCAFYTVPHAAQSQQTYVQVLCQEIRQVAHHGRHAGNLRMPPQGGRTVDTIFLGGGTPSLLTADEMQLVMGTLREEFQVLAGAEITLEANPETVTASSADLWSGQGVTRLSVGAQSFQDDVLKGLGRHHDARATRTAVTIARGAGIREISLDLIAGVQSKALMADLDEAIALVPDHLSMYLLEVDEEEVGGVTRLARSVARGTATVPDEDWFADVYPEAVSRLTAAGLRRYEISNFARGGSTSRHNLRYWHCQEVIGFGVSAHSLVAGQRHGIAADLDAYLTAAGCPELECDEGGDQDRVAEAWILGLRLDGGVTAGEVAVRTGVSQVSVPVARVQPAIDAGLMKRHGERLFLTDRGILLSNEVFQTFLP